KPNGDLFPVELALFGLNDPRLKTASYGAIIQNISEHHRLYKELEKKTRRLESLNRVSTLLASSLDRDKVLSMAAEQIVKLMRVDHCAISIPHDAENV